MKKTETRSAAEKEVERQIDELRREVAALTDNLGTIGSEKLHRVKKRAAHLLDGAREQGQDAIHEARRKLHDMQDEMGDTIRDKPFTSVAVAAGVGFIIANLLRR